LEINKLDPRVCTDKDVSEGDISMNYASLMQLLKSFDDAILQNYGHGGRGFHPEYGMWQVHGYIDLPRAGIYAYNVRDNVSL
jgi:hypothetical protein